MAIVNDHTVKAFDEDLNRLRGLISEMGGRAEQALLQAMTALNMGDLDLAAQVVQGDKKIDALETEVEQLTVQTIALRAPMADDLREMIAALKIVSVVERIGDYAKNIAKRVALMDQTRSIEAIPLLMSMSSLVVELVHDALDSFAARDADLAVRVTIRDKTVDDFYNSIFRALVTFMMENPKHITESAHLLFVAKNLERIGDHATNIAEMVHYVVTGERMEERERGEQPEDGAAEQEQG
ncbi:MULTISPECIES: phosphate signaling complex protein PhoU [Sphingopyxis]|uniref:phosphate signaling complex protein PhoU n=1 Tax=Sphingopyxis TaxID=165697 RepID=UPI00086C9FC1|nr:MULTISPECIES: phosphate signaling complex protein PhoU [Sphingopyxis]APW74275.1 phosphate transport system regulatory protein PhoU [Sphingopyxis granuli]AVA15853.1 phosphate transport system regulatory protein PhoU [Sphingopyxis sp. MG]ODU24352.1 MAG: phosphate transport system regulatory protein PhoU [Sphingopyxis sp. SCN 67-31]QUM71371.1 phosphate signaling complex protein PhoU [Sphingopyxis granuli]